MMKFTHNGSVVDPASYTADTNPRHFWLSNGDRKDEFELTWIDDVISTPSSAYKNFYCSRLGNESVVFPYMEFFKPTIKCDAGLNNGVYSLRRVLLLEVENSSIIKVKIKMSINVSLELQLMNNVDRLTVGNTYLMAISRDEQKAYPIYDINNDIAFENNCMLIGEFPKL